MWIFLTQQHTAHTLKHRRVSFLCRTEQHRVGWHHCWWLHPLFSWGHQWVFLVCSVSLIFPSMFFHCISLCSFVPWLFYSWFCKTRHSSFLVLFLTAAFHSIILHLVFLISLVPSLFYSYFSQALHFLVLSITANGSVSHCSSYCLSLHFFLVFCSITVILLSSVCHCIKHSVPALSLLYCTSLHSF